MSTQTFPKTAKIARLNDMMRQAPGIYGLWLETEGVKALPRGLHSEFIEAVETFNDFTTDNDPYGEHDFGKIEIEGIAVFWKIDAFERSVDEPYTWGSPDPSDPKITQRVLTIMLCSEY